MTGVPGASARAVERRLRALDPEERADFAAALWSARGFDTARDGRTVSATRDGASQLLFAAGTGGCGIPEDADVVLVAQRRAPSARYGARVVDAADLREMLWYAIDPSTRAALCERYLGAPPGELPVSASNGFRDRLGGLLEGSLPSVDRSLPSFIGAGGRLALPAAALVALAAVVGLAVLTGWGPTAAPTGGPAEFRATPGVVPTETATPTPAALAPDRLPPGVTAEGLVDPAALSVAHERAVGDSYTIWMDLYRPRGGDPDAPQIQRDVDVFVEGERYLLVATVVDTDGRRTVLQVYRDGEARYVADAGGNDTTYRRADAGPAPHVAPAPATLRTAIVTRYLPADRTTLAGTVAEDGRTLYRLVGIGGGPDAVSNYTATALVDSQGFVRSLRVEYRMPESEGGYAVRFEASYDRGGRTTADPPPWVGREFNNGSRSK